MLELISGESKALGQDRIRTIIFLVVGKTFEKIVAYLAAKTVTK